MVFVYDESGAPIAIHYRLNGSAENVFYTYYLEKNLQGDIIALYNSSGTKLVGYTYDAWGNCTTTYYNNGGSTGAQFNPFRYRGYYYDTDLGLYYLNSRYYDSRTGRFINSDSVLNGGVGLTSYNLFAYCSNNPVNYTDPTGNFAKDAKMISYSPGTPWARPYVFFDNFCRKIVFFERLKKDIENYDKYNDDEQKVLDSYYFSSYKGVPVIRTNGDRSGSFGLIFLTRESNNRSEAEDIVRHEYGHTKQLEQLGIVNYSLCIGIPSWQEWGEGSYYDKPWEITADIYGNVRSRNHSQNDLNRGNTYLRSSKLMGVLVWFLIG